MDLRTLNTIRGYLFSLLERLWPTRLSRNAIDSIYNYHPIDDWITTSGQPTEGQLTQIKLHGYQRVINLAPHSAENALTNEAQILQDVGLDYVHLPVDFRRPDEASYQIFCDTLDANRDTKIWIHCAANMRVSAFVYRYRVERKMCDEKTALNDLHKIWKPWGVWQNFVAKAKK